MLPRVRWSGVLSARRLVLSGALALACSSNVDGFHLGHRDSGLTENGGTPTGGADSGGNQNGAGATPAGGSGGELGSGGVLSDTGGAEAGGVGAGGAGGASSGGALTGGNAGSGGIVTSGGTGGLGTGGATPTGGATSSGGTATGGTAGTGGARATGGAPSTGGVTATGGVPSSGGASATGGVANTGGIANTGGAPNTGGTGGVTGPVTPTRIPIVGGPGGITAAAWTGSKFVLLQPSGPGFYTLDTNGTVSGRLALPSSAAVETTCIAASSTSVFAVVGTSAYALPLTGFTSQTASGTISHSTGALTCGHAGSDWLVGNSGGSAGLVPDGSSLASESGLSSITNVATDGNSFAFRAVSASNTFIHRIAPGATSLGAGCKLASGTFEANGAVSVSGSTVAWVETSTGSLFNAVIGSGDTCATAAQHIPLGQVSQVSPAVGLIDDTYALATPIASTTAANIAVEDINNGEIAMLQNVPLTAAPVAFVMANSSPPAHFGLLVTNNGAPVLLSF